jgi:beta-phosphoglucomutase-like phosphatase (HAD superfamily)
MYNIINNYDLFIFDLDDTLVKTEKLHYRCWMQVLKNKLGSAFNIEYSYFCSKFHSNKKDSIRNYLENDLKINNYIDLVNEKNISYIELLEKEKDNLTLIDGCEELLLNIMSNNKQFVIVSNSLKSNIDFFSNLFPILKLSSKNYYREMFTNKKPDPECYLKVLNDFSHIENIIGFEDSITGIQAMTSVPKIQTVFINTSDYYHYNYIINNYKNLFQIKDYTIFNLPSNIDNIYNKTPLNNKVNLISI